jgi:putative ABC transport system ATP-binding protein
VNLDVNAGEVVAVMGPSGSGKTTLLTIAGALQHPTSGQVELEGISLNDKSEPELARIRRERIGFIFQSFNLLQSLTALENVQYALELRGIRGGQARARARQLLAMLGLETRMQQLPKRLSGGEQQRIAVARAFATGGSIILADEPTANLDEARALGLMELLKALSRDLGPPIVMVTHDLRIHRYADRTFWLEGGHLRALDPRQLARTALSQIE